MIEKIIDFINDYNKDKTHKIRFLHIINKNPKFISFILFSEVNNKEFGFYYEYDDNLSNEDTEIIICSLKQVIEISNKKVKTKLVSNDNNLYFIKEE